MSGSSSSAAAATTAVMAHPSPATKYEVFLSFRGVDTRNSFTTYLHDKLGQKKIKTFIDYNIDRGNKISDELYTGIEESIIYVIIFSQNYASSAWCLKELVKIWECKERYGRHVIPVFYKVEPATIKYQKGSYEKAFADHINQKRFDEEEIKSWKVALNNAAELKGTSVDDTRPEIKVVDDIVEDIVKKLNRSFSSTYDQGMVGIDKHIAKMESLLQLESVGVRIIGIWGMGGIGKSTLARALHNKLATKFSSSCCVIHAQKEIERAGIDSLRAKILSELLDNEAIPSNGLHYAIERVKRARVLLILDDLKDSDQLEELVGGRGNFGQGSRIIVTSRDMQVLKNAEEDQIYQVTKMSDEDSQHLFSLNAFKQNPSVKTYKTLVERVLEYAQGVPLVLNVLGRLLCGKSIKVWESQLKKLQKFPHLEIFNVLKLSYDGLDDEEKDIFLEIVCFYVGQFEDIALDLLDGCGFSACIGMDVLKDRGLVSILHDRIVMHDLILEMGLEIVSQRVNNNRRKHVGLCKYEEIYNKQGMDAIHFLGVSKMKEDQLDPETFKNMPSLRILYFYKYTLFRQGQSNVNLPPTFLESLPDGLQILCWEGFPIRSLLLGSCRNNLVKLYMRNSHLKQLWEDDQDLPNLKRLDLSSSSNLIQIPDLFKFPNIEEIILRNCRKLTQVNSERDLLNLKSLDLSSSSNLIQIPDLSKFPNIEEIILHYCGKLIQVNSERDLPNLKRLDLSSSNLIQIPDLSKFPNIEEIILRCCGKLTQVDSERDLPNLKRVDISYSWNLIQIPDLSKFPNIEEIILNNCTSLTQVCSSSFLSELQCLWLSYCSRLTSLDIRSNILSRSSGLVGLQGCGRLEKFSICGTRAVGGFSGAKEIYDDARRLDVEYSNDLEKLRGITPSGFIHELCWLDLKGCQSLTSLPADLCKLKFLRRLYLNDCSNLVNFPEIEEPMENLAVLCLERTPIQELPSSLHRLVGLEELYLDHCNRLKMIPSSIGTLTKLCKLELDYCESLETFPSSIFKLKLTKLNLLFCSKLKTFPEILEPAESFTDIGLIGTAIKELPSSLDRLVGLQTLRIESNDLESLPNNIGNLNLLSWLACVNCGKLTEIPNDIGRLSSSLTKLSLRNIGIVSLPESIAHLSRLESLDVSGCKKLECIPALPPSMTELLAFRCPSITRVVSNPPDSKEGTFIFNLTSNFVHNPSATCNIVEDARLKIIEGAYRSVYYFFPGSAVPHWFPYHCEGNSLTVDKDSLNWCHDNRVTGFAVCAVLQYTCDYLRFSLTYESDGRTHELPYDGDDQLNNSLSTSFIYMEKGFHTVLWKYDLMGSASIDKGTFHALKLTFKAGKSEYVKSEYATDGFQRCGIFQTKKKERCGIFRPKKKERCVKCPFYTKEKKLILKLNDGLVERCGICPLYTKEKKKEIE